MKTIDQIYNLIGFWNEDQWDLRRCGFEHIEKMFQEHVSKYRVISFEEVKQPKIKKELKYYLFCSLQSYKGIYESLRQYLLRPINVFMRFLEQEKMNIKTMCKIDDTIAQRYWAYLEECNIPVRHTKQYSYKTMVARFPITVSKFFVEAYDERKGLERDIWYVDDLHLSEDRINRSGYIHSLYFYDLMNEHNKDRIKQYCKYLFLNTGISIGFIYQKQRYVKRFLKFIADTKAEQVQRKHIEQYIEFIQQLDIDDETYNVHLYAVKEFLDFGIKQGWRKKNELYIEYDIKEFVWRFKNKGVSSHVTDQIFSHLDQMPLYLSCMFLLLYCCGMRASEVCLMRKDGLLKNEKGYFIRFYQQKMKKEVTNPITQALYDLLMKQRDMVNQIFGQEEVYLFPRAKGYPMLYIRFGEEMKKHCARFEVKNEDGTPYIFRAHDYRHAFASRLVENNVPFAVIQKLLHHNSPEMSLIYIQMSDRKKQKRYTEFMDLVGNRSPQLFEKDAVPKEIYDVQWLKKQINAQALPNGYCALPVVMGQCPHANACLICEHFRTTIYHLDILKRQLERTNGILKVCKENNWIPQIKVNKQIQENLSHLICQLEQEL